MAVPAVAKEVIVNDRVKYVSEKSVKTTAVVMLEEKAGLFLLRILGTSANTKIKDPTVKTISCQIIYFILT